MLVLLPLTITVVPGHDHALYGHLGAAVTVLYPGGTVGTPGVLALVGALSTRVGFIPPTGLAMIAFVAACVAPAPAANLQRTRSPPALGRRWTSCWP